MRKRRPFNRDGTTADGPLPAWARNRWVALILFIAVLALAEWLRGPASPSRGPAPTSPLAGSPRLVDGDSFHLGGDEVRLVGIDAPEGRQTCTRNGAIWPCGEDSWRTLMQLIAKRSISCTARERDQHGRVLAVCFAGQTELNREMVASGMAVAYGNYEREEAAARAARRGLWSGEFERPKAWRRQHGTGRE
jgi:endonuclease YncB( thermonuclease family)